MLNRVRQFIDDAPVSRSAKPIGYYCSSPAIDALATEFGQHLEKVSPLQKCLMGAVLFDQLGAGSEHYTPFDTLDAIDPDSLLENELSNALLRIFREDANLFLAALCSAIAAYVADDIRNGQE